MSPASSSISTSSTNVPNATIAGLIVICGATATGKSGLAIALSQRLHSSRLNSAILSADSRQVYREFNIGTAKPSIADQKTISHHLIDICDPTETLTVADYQLQAQGLIEGRGEERETRSAGDAERSLNLRTPHLALRTSSPTPNLQPPTPIPSSSFPLLVGGTGLYIRSVTKGLKIPRVPPQMELRSQLGALGQATCYAMLQQVDPRSAEKIHAHDVVRTVRSLEVFYTTGCPMSAQQGENPPPYPILHIGLDCLEPNKLWQRIAHRAKQMVAAGFVTEVEYLCSKYGTELPLLNTLGYAEFKRYLLGDLTLDAALEETIVHTRQFAKRQRTWFRSDPEICWFDADAADLEDQVWQAVAQFIQSCAHPTL
ncbi:MAG: tRNA (adenosine(37)-N6)-dimethylallyltransferase MiaA [Leptolyngbyaceae cyanobacterium bins.302]|nr:tRNA (adenosine(37)-N6)-dimethylallyltransferase MiaA [Leptolyngbyaceae cyanobacterium bins.302]